MTKEIRRLVSRCTRKHYDGVTSLRESMGEGVDVGTDPTATGFRWIFLGNKANIHRLSSVDKGLRIFFNDQIQRALIKAPMNTWADLNQERFETPLMSGSQ